MNKTYLSSSDKLLFLSTDTLKQKETFTLVSQIRLQAAAPFWWTHDTTPTSSLLNIRLFPCIHRITILFSIFQNDGFRLKTFSFMAQANKCNVRKKM